MQKKPKLSFWLTKFGRNTSFGIICGIGGAALIASFTPHTEFLGVYEDFVHHYVDGEKSQLSNKLKKRFDECLEMMNFEDIYKKDQKAFPVAGFDLFHAGNAYTRKGSIIGIPKNYEYESEEDIDKPNMRLGTNSIQWISDAGDELSSALVVAEEVQKFGMLRELVAVKNKEFYVQTLWGPTAVTFTYFTSNYINRKLNLFERQKSIRCTFYLLASMFFFGYYIWAKDATHIYFERKIDKEMCEFGPKVIEAGVKFYDNLLKRNKALRTLHGPDGEVIYGVDGNLVQFFRQKYIPLSERKKFFETQLEEYKRKMETQSNNTQ